MRSGRPRHLCERCRFEVSPVVAARRALDLKLINKTQFFGFYQKDRQDFLKRKKEQGQKKKSGGNFYATQAGRLGHRFSSAVLRAVGEGRILYQEAFRLTGLKGETFDRYAEFVLERMKNERQ